MKTDDMRHELIHLGGGAHALAIQILGNPDDAADAVQDALTSALARPGAYEPDKGPLKPWFLRMVRNRCIDLLRRRRPVVDDIDAIPSVTPGPEQIAETADRNQKLEDALAMLSADQRQIIVLRDYMDLPYAHISEVLDVAPGTVMSRLHRARLALGRAYREANE